MPSYIYREEVRVGAVLPERGVTYREIPAEYGAEGYSRTVIGESGIRYVTRVIE